MKNKLYLFGALCALLALPACDDYLSVELQDQMTLEEVFNKRVTTERYLAHVYSYLPNQYDLIWGEGGVVPRSDEASYSWPSIEYINYNNGNWGPTSGSYTSWTPNYQGINQATIFMNNVDKCVEINQQTKDIMKAEARFLRAYFYFTLLRKYGPVIVWGDQDPNPLVKPETVDRNTFDENLDFIISEYDKAIASLPTEITDEAWYGRITKSIVMAAKSRLLLYAARPLFNGCEWYKGMVNMDGKFLFPQENDPQKWDKAAQAAKELIDLNQYSLYEDKKETDPLKKAIKSYMGVVFEKWNDEIIWGVYLPSSWDINVRCAPPRVVKEGYGGICPSIKLVDTYPMAESGRYPVTGYEANGTPIIDPKSGYSDEGFVDSWTHPIENFATVKMHNSCIGRDARFYASVFANGMFWINTYKGEKLVTFFDGGTSSFLEAGDCVKVGYLWRRFLDPTNNHEDGKWGSLCWPLYRLAEIYLNYAEACNEKPSRNEAEALKYINLVRNRSGLNNLEKAYPEVVGNKELFRELIQKERMVELAFEGHRYYDIRTWMIADKEFSGTRYARNLLAKNYEDSWKRTDQIFKDKMVCEPKHYLFPIHQDQLKEMKNITQNYGW